MVIRVGIIGLSSVTTNVSASPGDSWAASAHLPYLLASPHFEIAALCNSSVKSAQIAAERYNLPSSTKLYGSPEDLAKDPNVDLVVCSVRVDMHHQLMMPVIEAGKDVFVEWPLASNLAQATEMYTAAQKSGSKTIVGLQGRTSPSIRKMKELVAKGTVGELLSSTLEFTLDQPGDVEPPATEYFSKKESGGNFFTILFAHVADSVIHTLGGLEEVSTLLTTRWPETKLLKADGTFDRMVKRETPDHVMVQGTLKNNSAPISMVARNGKGFKDSPNLVWRILGTKGQIRMTSAVLLNLGLGGEKIEVFDHEKDAVEVVDAHDAEEVKDLTPFAKNIGMLYEGYVKGWGVEDGFVGFEQALGMHTIIDRMENSSEGRKYEKITL